MMKKVWILALAIVLSACAGSREAKVDLSWVTAPQTQYPTALFLTGIGISEDLAAAKKQAKAEIASQIQTTIQSDITDIEREISDQGIITSESDFTQKIREITEISISGVQYPNIEEKDGKYYVLGVLDKAQYLQDINTQLNEIHTSITDLHNSINEQLPGGGLLVALDNYSQITDLLEDFTGLRSIYNAVSHAPYSRGFDFSAQTLRGELVSLIRTLELSLLDGGNQNGQVGKYLQEPVRVQATYRYDESKTPASGMYIEFRNTNGASLSKIETNSSGIAQARIIAIPGDVSEQGEVEVSFASMPYGKLNRNVRTKKLIVPYSMFQPKYDFTLQLLNGTPEARDLMQSKMEKFITDLGYAIQQNSPARLQVSLGIATSQSFSGFSGKQYLAEAHATIKLIETISGAILGQTEFIGKGLDKESRAGAEAAAYENIRVENDKLISLISGAEDRLTDLYQN